MPSLKECHSGQLGLLTEIWGCVSLEAWLMSLCWEGPITEVTGEDEQAACLVSPFVASSPPSTRVPNLCVSLEKNTPRQGEGLLSVSHGDIGTWSMSLSTHSDPERPDSRFTNIHKQSCVQTHTRPRVHTSMHSGTLTQPGQTQTWGRAPWLYPSLLTFHLICNFSVSSTPSTRPEVPCPAHQVPTPRHLAWEGECHSVAFMKKT